MATPENQKKIMWLSRYRSICRRIGNKLNDIERLHSIETKITPTISDMPKAASGENKIESATESIMEIQSQIADEIRQLTFTRSEIENAIRAVPNENYRELLELRYIDGLTWEKIAVKLDKSYQWVCELHGRALKKIPEYLIEIDTLQAV